MKFLNSKYLILLILGLFIFSPTIAAYTFIVFSFLNFFFKLNTTIAFREFLVLIYTLNYLLSPLLVYSFGNIEEFSYGMKISQDEYLHIAFPCMVAFYLSIFLFKTNLFNVDLLKIRVSAVLNDVVLKQWIYFGVFLNVLLNFSLPNELRFFVYLFSTIRFIGAFGLLMIDLSKYKLYIFSVFFYEISKSIQSGMFHDVSIWLIFFTLILFFIYKFSNIIKVTVFIVGVLIMFLLQSTKGDYREATWRGNEEASFSSFANVASSKVDDSKGLFSEENIIGSISRINQGWIFASTVNNMNYKQNFQGFDLIIRYLEAGVLPRFLSPDKLSAGDSKIFNEYSGHFIGKGTAMGLGILADGYISFGYWGAIFFAVGYGFLYSGIFYIVGKWNKVSPFFFLFLLPILFYAVRPDCETQTSLGHMIKSTFVFGVLVTYYKGYFEKARKYINLMESRKNQILNPIINTSN